MTAGLSLVVNGRSADRQRRLTSARTAMSVPSIPVPASPATPR
jgi:hypothetical protein